jgi:hypothetical protein
MIALPLWSSINHLHITITKFSIFHSIFDHPRIIPVMLCRVVKILWNIPFFRSGQIKLRPADNPLHTNKYSISSTTSLVNSSSPSTLCIVDPLTSSIFHVDINAHKNQSSREIDLCIDAARIPTHEISLEKLIDLVVLPRTRTRPLLSRPLSNPPRYKYIR